MTWNAAIVESPTEQRNPRTTDVDRLGTQAVLELINAEDRSVAPAVAKVLPALATAVDLTVERVRRGGRIHYFGAGTPARLAAADAAELPPTFNAPHDLFTAHVAGGATNQPNRDESAEDDADQGGLDAAAIGANDVAIGLSASGRTPYVAGALAAARARHAVTVLITSNPSAPLATLADVVIAPETGPEVIAGSTRMKAGTAQKLILNAYSTAVMVRLGHTWSNLMISVEATNEKLRGRAIRILQEATQASEEQCRSTLSQANGNLKVALVALIRGLDVPDADRILRDSGGSIHEAIPAPRATTHP